MLTTGAVKSFWRPRYGCQGFAYVIAAPSHVLPFSLLVFFAFRIIVESLNYGRSMQNRGRSRLSAFASKRRNSLPLTISQNKHSSHNPNDNHHNAHHAAHVPHSSFCRSPQEWARRRRRMRHPTTASSDFGRVRHIRRGRQVRAHKGWGDERAVQATANAADGVAKFLRQGRDDCCGQKKMSELLLP